MLPDFDAHGYLPPGIHRCNLAGVIARFERGSSERQVETSELLAFVAWARQAGVQRLVIDGSYVMSKIAPNDVDVVILPDPDYPREARAARQGIVPWPFVHVIIATDEADFERWASADFGLDRSGIPRGVVEIEL